MVGQIQLFLLYFYHQLFLYHLHIKGFSQRNICVVISLPELVLVHT